MLEEPPSPEALNTEKTVLARIAEVDDDEEDDDADDGKMVAVGLKTLLDERFLFGERDKFDSEDFDFLR